MSRIRCSTLVTVFLATAVACESAAPGLLDASSTGDAPDDRTSGSTSTDAQMGTTGSGSVDGTTTTDGGHGSGTTSSAPGDSSESGDGPWTGRCVTDNTDGTHHFECDHLTFDVSVPPRCLQESCGLILDVHGRTMSGPMQEANTGLMALGLERGYVVVQPNAIPAPPLSSWDGPSDDPTVVRFVEESIVAYGIDADRVHLTGFSQGGRMTWRLLADHGEMWASAAPAAACGVELPSSIVPVLYMHGTADALTSYACAEPYVETLVAHYDLESEGVTVESSQDHVRVRYGAQGPAIVELLSHDYDGGNPILGGHCYPGSSDPGGAPGQLFSFACGGDEAFTWGESVIDFFDAHPRSAERTPE